MRPHTHRQSLVVMLVLLTVTSTVQIATAQMQTSPTTPQGTRSKNDSGSYPSLTWRFETESQITDTPVLTGETLLVHSEDGYLYALNEANGELRWRLKTGHARFSRAEFTVSGGTVFVADTLGKLVAVDVTSGDELWSVEAAQSDESKIFSPPTVLEGVVYVDDIEGEFGNVYALDAGTGETIWQAQVGRMSAYALPVVDGTVVVTDIDGHVWLLDADTGDLLSQYDTGNLVEFAPTVADGVAYLGVRAGRIDAIDIQTAEVWWSVELPVDSDLPPSTLGVAGDVLLVNLEDRLFGLSTEDGEIRWEFSSAYSTRPTIDGNRIYTLDPDMRLTAIDAATGDPLWSSGHRSERLTVGDRLYAGVGQSVYALDQTTGEELWRIRTGGLVYASPLVSGQTMYIGSADHSLYAFDLQGRTDNSDGFANQPSTVQDDQLLTIRLEGLPNAPAFAGIWRATIDAGEEETLPSFAGPAAAMVRGGSLSSSDGLIAGSGPEITMEAQTADDGQNLVLPVGQRLTLQNEGNTTVELLIVGMLPDGADLPAEGSGARLELLGGAMVDLLPGEGAFVQLHRMTLNSGSSLLPTLSVWPDVLAVEHGAIVVKVDGDTDVATLESGDSLAMSIGVTRFVRASSGESATVLLLQIDGNIHIGQGAGCGGRCLTPRQ